MSTPDTTEADRLSAELRDCSKKLNRHSCGSAVVMKYEPGVTWIHCFGCNRTVAAEPDWCPTELAEKWNSGGSEE